MLIIVLALLFCLVRLFRVAFVRTRYRYRRLGEPQATKFRSQPKLPWVRQEVIRLKALMREAGTCRVIAGIFNRRFAAKRRMTVGKTFVSEVIRRHSYEIETERRRLKYAKPKAIPRNLVWGVDLTGKATLDGKTRTVLGHSRAREPCGIMVGSASEQVELGVDPETRRDDPAPRPAAYRPNRQ